MAVYNYTGRDSKGQDVSGEIDAESTMLARRQLRQQKIMVIEIGEVSKNILPKLSLTDRFPITTRDSVFFCRQLAMMLKSGLTLVNSLNTMSREFPKAKMRETLLKIIEDIRNGMPLSESMEQYPKVFTPLLTKVMSCAEQTGDMSMSLMTVADQLEFRNAMKKKTISACVYPAVVLMMAFGVGMLMVFLVIPKFDEFLTKKGVPLPSSTMALLNISRFAQNYWLHMIIATLVLSIALVLMFRNSKGRRIQEKLVISIPLFGKLFKSSVVANFSTTSSLLLRSGMGVVDALKMNAKIINFKIYNDLFLKASEHVITGRSLTDSLRNDIIPPTVTNIVAVGEETGALQDVLEEIGNFYEDEVKRSVEFLVSAIEPVMLVIVGGIVALVYFALFQAIIRLMGT